MVLHTTQMHRFSLKSCRNHVGLGLMPGVKSAGFGSAGLHYAIMYTNNCLSPVSLQIFAMPPRFSTPISRGLTLQPCTVLVIGTFVPVMRTITLILTPAAAYSRPRHII